MSTAGDETKPDAGQDDIPSGSRIRVLSWSFGAQGVARIGNFATGLVLARLLTPESFGTYAIAISLLAILLQIDDLGVFRGLVRWPGSFAEIAPTARLLSTVVGISLYAAVFSLAPLISIFVDDSEATGVIRIVCIGIVLDSCVQMVPAAYLQRTFRQREVLLVEVAAILIGSFTSVGLSIAGFEVWALALGTLAGGVSAAVATAALARLPWRYGWDTDLAREVLRFSVPAAGAGLVGALVLNVDYLVIARFLGNDELGLYLIAFNIASWPATLVGSATRAVSAPQFAHLVRSGGDASHSYCRGLCALVLASAPFVTLVLAAPGTILVALYGAQWLEGAGALQFLVILSIVRLVDGLTDDLIYAHGESLYVLLKNIVWLLLLVLVLPVAARVDGIRGVAIGHVLIGMLFVVPVVAGNLYRLRTWRSGLGRVLIVILGFCFALVPVSRWFVRSSNLKPLATVILAALVGTILLGLSLLPFIAKIRRQLT